MKLVASTEPTGSGAGTRASAGTNAGTSAGTGTGPSLLRRQMAVGCRVLSLNGHDDFNQGQVSARARGAGEFHIKNAFRGFDDAGPEDMLLCPIDPGARLPRDAPPETPLHQAIYRARPDVGAIVHSHAEYATVFGATDLPLEPISHEGAFFQGRIGRFDETSHTILEHEVASAVARALAGHSALLLCNHGLVVVAPTLRQCAVLTLMLERACKLQLLAQSTRQRYRVTRADEVEKKRDYIYSEIAFRNYWNHAVQAAARAFPEVRGW
ncbi:class II aldolase/adducin family protein [Ramlibacter sp.]|uniref:class II aldolase/adducin family protein n=1 Tax=Ramlibacter sp. TaxID=1917967 RepID=UPI0018596967|nr:class II aldolase/adducin family protein [Ramlibacter sp.]MBA2674938.1 class II aldolase/adducin family protein [Ramlibacter sp.]